MQLVNNREPLEAEVPVEKPCSATECKKSIYILEKVSTLPEWRTLIIILPPSGNLQEFNNFYALSNL